MRKSDNKGIAVVGIGCRYPGASHYNELWENILSGRREFRHIPEKRLGEAYFSDDDLLTDYTYNRWAAVLKNYRFDRAKFNVSGRVFRTADLAHWLALDVANDALEDASFSGGEGLPKQDVGVFVGNSLTGEFSRAGTMRLRWPYVLSTVLPMLEARGWDNQMIRDFALEFEARYKAPFPKIGEDSLAGGLSNTIAGRICNYFDFKGGGYTVDGACSSSLLAICHACQSLEAGEIKVGLAGGVDLSLDPFELVGFSRIGAIARNFMRVYDKRSEGFWPGEGCGMVVLMRAEDALSRNCKIFGYVRGWGISSDGQGGLTRPEKQGHMLAMERAYAKAGYSISTLNYFEGHGTGTPVGDPTELAAISEMVNQNLTENLKVPVGSVKANIGHTKAAAGAAGFIKALLCAYRKVVPPASGVENPHSFFDDEDCSIRLPRRAEFVKEKLQFRSAVSAMGFGGINTHITIQGPEENPGVSDFEEKLDRSWQDCELFIWGGKSLEELKSKLENIKVYSSKISLSEMGDLASELAKQYEAQTYRAAIVASLPAELDEKLGNIISEIDSGNVEILNFKKGVFLSSKKESLKIAYLFPGQASPVRFDGGLLARRFPFVANGLKFPKNPGKENIDTAIAQPSIIAATLHGIRILNHLGFEASSGIGHSLGELSALHWAGSLDENQVMDLARFRGKTMVEVGGYDGGMLSVGMDAKPLKPLLQGMDLNISSVNTPGQTVISGSLYELDVFQKDLKAKGIASTMLKVSHAFHSPLMEPVRKPLEDFLAKLNLEGLVKSIFSTITGDELDSNAPVASLLIRQLTDPVRFYESFMKIDADLFIEVGPGQVLGRMVSGLTDKPVISLDACGESLSGLLKAVAFAFATGGNVNIEELFKDRFVRPFDLTWKADFLENPCEHFSSSQKVSAFANLNLQTNGENGKRNVEEMELLPGGEENILESLRKLIAKNLELPISSILPENKMLDDLHLNSITVSQLIVEASKLLNTRAPAIPTEYANASVQEIADVLKQLGQNGISKTEKKSDIPSGIAHWAKAYKRELYSVASTSISPDLPKPGNWKVLGSKNENIISQIPFLKELPGFGLITLIWGTSDEEQIALLIETAMHIAKSNPLNYLVLCQTEECASGFVKSIYLEYPELKVILLTGEWVRSHLGLIKNEIKSCKGFTEVYYDNSGKRKIWNLIPLPLNSVKNPVLPDSKDVFLVTGGGKGITAEIALGLSMEAGCSLVLLGRSLPESDAVLKENLERFEEEGIRMKYYPCDLCDEIALGEVWSQAQKEVGSITGILHGAGLNRPVLSAALNKEHILETLNPKYEGLNNLLRMPGIEKLKFLFSLSSIIARSGMQGNADYALANEWLSRETLAFGEKHPKCRTLALEWSVWGGTGMGDKLGLLEMLLLQGIQPIGIDQGLKLFSEILHSGLSNQSLILTGRIGKSQTLEMYIPDREVFRFVERIPVNYPGAELICEADISLQHDPYLQDHVLEGQAILPGVIGLEAMAQALEVFRGTSEPGSFQDVEFNRAIVVPDDKSLCIRTLLLEKNNRSVEMAIRSEGNEFGIDHIRATFRPGSSKPVEPDTDFIKNLPKSSLNPKTDVYGDLLFHTGRFQRIKAYAGLSWNGCVAKILPSGKSDWFGKFLPQKLLLGDPGARDAALQAIQACVPDAVLLPVRTKGIYFYQKNAEVVKTVARELKQQGDVYVYNIWLLDSLGKVIGFWKEAEFRIVSRREKEQNISPELALVILKRGLEKLEGEGHSSISLVKGKIKKIYKNRPDGRPVGGGGIHYSRAYHEGFTFEIRSDLTAGVDLESVEHRGPKTWTGMLGDDHFKLAALLSKEMKETTDMACTRIWGALESLRKAGAGLNAPMVFSNNFKNGMGLITAGEYQIISYPCRLDCFDDPVVFTILTQPKANESLLV